MDRISGEVDDSWTPKRIADEHEMQKSLEESDAFPPESFEAGICAGEALMLEKLCEPHPFDCPSCCDTGRIPYATPEETARALKEGKIGIACTHHEECPDCNRCAYCQGTGNKLLVEELDHAIDEVKYKCEHCKGTGRR